MSKDHNETERLCLAHIAALRANPCFASARIVFIPECNLGAEGRVIAERLIDRGVHVACQKPTDYGIRTLKGSKRDYVSRLLSALELNSVRYHDKLIAANPFRIAQGISPEQVLAETKREFEDQLSRFSAHLKTPKQASGGEVSVIYSGKIDPQGRHSSRMRDDLALAMLMAAWASGQVIANQFTVLAYDRRLQAPLDLV